MAAQCSRGACSTWPGLRVSGVSSLSSDTIPHRIIQVKVLADILSNHYGCHIFPSNDTRQHEQQVFNILSPGRRGGNFKSWMFRLNGVADDLMQNSSLGTRRKIALRWMPENFTTEMSTLHQVMAWCPQAPSHYLMQCWPRSFSPYGTTRPQWVNCAVPHPLRISIVTRNRDYDKNTVSIFSIRKKSTQFVSEKLSCSSTWH